MLKTWDQFFRAMRSGKTTTLDTGCARIPRRIRSRGLTFASFRRDDVIGTWMRSFNEGLAEMRHGAQFCDLTDEDQQEILGLRELGMTPDEVLDVFEEVEGVD